MYVACHNKTGTRLLSYFKINKGFLSPGLNAATQKQKYSEFRKIQEQLRFQKLQDEECQSDDFMGPLNTYKKFPLPGNLAVLPIDKPYKAEPSGLLLQIDLLDGETRCDKQLKIVSHLMAESDIFEDSNACRDHGLTERISDKIIRQYFKDATVELAVQECPKILVKEFCSIFLEIPSRNISVITIAQKSANDMSAWSEDVESEREKLLESFILTATEICQHLRANNFWCDFIDPTSGQAYFGPYTNSTLFETDDRYNSLGFRVDDLGCCKVMTHTQWGTNVFTGTIVTTAKTNHIVMRNLLRNSVSPQCS